MFEGRAEKVGTENRRLTWPEFRGFGISQHHYKCIFLPAVSCFNLLHRSFDSIGAIVVVPLKSP